MWDGEYYMTCTFSVICTKFLCVTLPSFCQSFHNMNKMFPHNTFSPVSEVKSQSTDIYDLKKKDLDSLLNFGCMKAQLCIVLLSKTTFYKAILKNGHPKQQIITLKLSSISAPNLVQM